MSSIDFATLQSVIQQWVVTGSGLAGNQVIWGGQNSPRPTGTFIELRLTMSQMQGIDWHDNEFLSNTFTQYTRGPRKATVTMQCFDGVPGSGNTIGNRTPVSILTDVIAWAGSQSVLDALNVVCGLGSISSVTSLDGVIDQARYEQRALCTVEIHLASEISEVAGYIDTVNTEVVGSDGVSTVFDQTITVSDT